MCAQIGALLDQDRGSEERRIAICVVDDLLEHSPAGRAKYMPQVCVCVCVCRHVFLCVVRTHVLMRTHTRHML